MRSIKARTELFPFQRNGYTLWLHNQLSITKTVRIFNSSHSSPEIILHTKFLTLVRVGKQNLTYKKKKGHMKVTSRIKSINAWPSQIISIVELACATTIDWWPACPFYKGWWQICYSSNRLETKGGLFLNFTSKNKNWLLEGSCFFSNVGKYEKGPSEALTNKI